MLTIKYHAGFRRDIKRIMKRGYNMKLLEAVVAVLASGQPLDKKYRDHALSGNWAGTRECHITPDWLLIYELHDNELFLELMRTGSHSDLF